MKSKRVFIFSVPKGIDKRLWMDFINSKCSNCENPKNGCTEILATTAQAKKCYGEWLASYKVKEGEKT